MLCMPCRPIGMPRLERVMVQNTGTQDSIRLVSISGSSVQFHCSFFQDKVGMDNGVSLAGDACLLLGCSTFHRRKAFLVWPNGMLSL